MVSSALLAFAFVFGSTAATMFRALIMIFSTNPFGVGDWVRMGDDTVKIKELGLNFIVVINVWGEVLFVPVTTMLDSRIFNLSRSSPLWMSSKFIVDLGRAVYITLNVYIIKHDERRISTLKNSLVLYDIMYMSWNALNPKP